MRIGHNMRKATKLEQKAKPQTPRELALYRASLNCKIGRDALEGVAAPMRGVSETQYALFCLLHAVEDIAKAMGEKQ